MKKITREELDQVLQHHKLWLDSDGANGKLADLQGADLQGANLQGANLHGAALQSTNLRSADLRHTRFDTNIRDCSSFSSALFTPDALPWLILHPRWPELKDTVQIESE